MGVKRPALLLVVFVCFAAPLLTPLAARAQAVPDAGSVLRQIEEQQRQSLPPDPTPELAPAPPPLESIGGDSVTVSAFRFSGNTLLTDAQLTEKVAEYVGRPIDFAGLQNAAIAVATAFRNEGWVVRAYLPQQDITGGSVTIQVVEARFGAAHFEGDPRRVSVGQLRRIVERTQKPLTPVSAARLDRSLLLINDLPGVTATGRLAAGINDTETDLIIAVEDDAAVNGHVMLDNAGARYTGDARMIGAAHLNNRFGIGDRADALLLYSEGSTYVRLGFSMPVGSRGWRVGTHASHLGYEIVTEEFAALEAHGRSTTFGVDANYPLVRSRLQNLYLSVNADRRGFDNRSAGTSTTQYSTRTLGLGLQGNRFDQLGRGGVTTAGLSLVRGSLDLSGSPNEAADAATTQTAGGFGRATLSVSRFQTITEKVALFISIERQLAGTNLDSSQKMYLGGSQGVRAYPESEAGGAQGTLARFEVRTRVTPSFHITGFADSGKVDINKYNDFPGAPERNSTDLKGFGMLFSWTSRPGLNLQMSLARRSGSNPNAALNGNDQDGSLVRNRIWLQASMPF